MSGLKIGTRSKLLVAALGLLMMSGCVVAPSPGYYDPYPYGYSGYSGGAVVLNYQSYGHPYHSRRHWDHGRRHGHGHWR